MPSANGSQQNFQTIPQPSSVNNAAMQLGAISYGDMQQPSVSGNIIAANSILTGHLTNNLISNSNLQSASVSGNAIGTGCIIDNHIGRLTNIVSNSSLQSAAVSGNAIAAQSININHLAPQVFSSHRNAIINGNMNIWQRLSGNGFTGITTTQYCADRFFAQCNGPTMSAFKDQGIVPNNAASSIKLQCTTASALSGSNYATLAYVVEGYDLIPLKGKTCTLSFWAYTNLPGTYAVSLRNNGNSSCYVSNFTITQANTWQQIVITFTHNAGLTWSYDTNLGMSITITLAVGISAQASQSNTWLTGNFLGTASGNGLGVNTGFTYGTGNLFYVAQMQLEVGDTPTPFEFVPIQREVQACQRYYQKSFDLNVGPFNGVPGGQGNPIIAISNGATGLYNNVQFLTEMRAVPAITYYGYASNVTGQWRDSNNSATLANASTFQVGTHGFTASDGGTSIAAARWLIFWAANADF